MKSKVVPVLIYQLISVILVACSPSQPEGNDQAAKITAEILVTQTTEAQETATIGAEIEPSTTEPQATATSNENFADVFGVATGTDFFAVNIPPGDYLLTYTTRLGEDTQIQLLIRTDDTALVTVGLTPKDQVNDATIQEGTIIDTSQFVTTKREAVTIFARNPSLADTPISKDIFMPKGILTKLIRQNIVVGPPLPPLPKPGPPIIIPAPRPRRPTQEDCEAVINADLSRRLAKRDEQILKDFQEEVKRQLSVEVIVDPTEIVLYKSKESEILIVHFKEPDVKLPQEFYDRTKTAFEEETKKGAEKLEPYIDYWKKSLKIEGGVKVEFRSAWIDIKPPDIATVAKKGIDLEKKIILAEILATPKAIAAAEAGESQTTIATGGIAEFDIKFNLLITFSLEETDCPSLPVDGGITSSVSLDLFEVPIKVVPTNWLIVNEPYTYYGCPDGIPVEHTAETYNNVKLRVEEDGAVIIRADYKFVRTEPGVYVAERIGTHTHYDGSKHEFRYREILKVVSPDRFNIVIDFYGFDCPHTFPHGYMVRIKP